MRTWLAGSALALIRSVALAVIMAAGASLLLVMATLGAVVGSATAVLSSSGSGRLPVALTVAIAGTAAWLALVPLILLAIRPLADAVRRLSGDWCGVPISRPYRPRPAAAGLAARLGWLLTDPATWRDLLWTAANACAGSLLLLIPATLVGVGVIGFLGSQVIGTIPPPAYPGNTPVSILIVGVALTGAGLLAAPWFMRGYGLLASSVLGPPSQADLAQRVRTLSRTRAEAIDAGAAEVRRIERDLHDGAQARLVAMGMTLDAAGQLIGKNPEAAQALLIEARENSIRALAELRNLVRGIHPPVLADRGLADALYALALDSPLHARVTGELAGRPPAPVESAAYFAVSELLANIFKHAGADQAWIDIRFADGMLKITVADDGSGGANPAAGTGLRGIERRIAAFDGVLAISSPPGGPTVVTLEIPCTLGGPRYTSGSGG